MMNSKLPPPKWHPKKTNGSAPGFEPLFGVFLVVVMFAAAFGSAYLVIA